MTNTIQWSRQAVKQLRRLPVHDGKQVYKAVDTLKTFPISRNVKRLVEHYCSYRLRAGRYRVLFNYDGEIKVVSIEEVKKRDEQTY